MRNYTFTENGFTFKRINKAQAKRAYNNDLTVRFCPVNLRPGSPFRFDMDMNKVQQNCAGVDFEPLVNVFEFYNCGSNETGKYTAFYVPVETGDAVQVGFVITGKTEFQRDNGEWVTQFIDLWVEILTITETKF